MKRPTFNETVNVLVQAYLNNTLQRSNCHACAVGNMVASARNIKFQDTPTEFGRKMWDGVQPLWGRVFMTSGSQGVWPDQYKGEAKIEIDSTGYTWQELAKIEYAFEAAPIGKCEDDGMFNGLMAVVDVLAEIHNIDAPVKEQAKLLFQ